MLASVTSVFLASEEQITAFMNDFISRLPEYMQKPLRLPRQHETVIFAG